MERSLDDLRPQWLLVRGPSKVCSTRRQSGEDSDVAGAAPAAPAADVVTVVDIEPAVDADAASRKAHQSTMSDPDLDPEEDVKQYEGVWLASKWLLSAVAVVAKVVVDAAETAVGAS